MRIVNYNFDYATDALDLAVQVTPTLQALIFLDWSQQTVASMRWSDDSQITESRIDVLRKLLNAMHENTLDTDDIPMVDAVFRMQVNKTEF